MLRRDAAFFGAQTTRQPGEGAGRKPSTLVLFDIDGTLVEGGIFSAMFTKAAEAVLGRVPQGRESHIVGGMGVLEEATLMAEEAGTPKERVNEVARAIVDRAVEYFAERLESSPAKGCNGAAELLAALGGNGDVVLGIVTHNIEQVAWLKLESSGLSAFFKRDGVFLCADSSQDKTENIRAAMCMAADRFNVPFMPNNVVYFGDQVSDVAAARAAGIRAVGVGTGRSKLDELGSAGANAVFNDLSDTGAVVAAIGIASRQREKVKNA